MNNCPAMLTVIPQTVNVSTEIWSISTATVHSMTLITRLVIKYIRFDFNLVCGVGVGKIRHRTHERINVEKNQLFSDKQIAN